MLRLYGIVARGWMNRKNFDTAERQKARADVAGRQPAIVVTGGSRGIGLEIARTFLTNGHIVLIIARDAASLTAEVANLNSLARGRCHALALDVTAPVAATRIDEALQHAGLYCDVLVNNAAIGVSGPFTENAETDVEALFALNVAALTRLMHAQLPGMLARGSGGVINLASLGGYVPGPHQAAYYASKAYVLSLSEAVAAEVSGRGVNICAIAPGPIDTRFHEDMRAEHAIYRRFLPALTPAHVAAAAYRGFTNGQRVVVPGLHYRFAFLSLRLLPHFISVPLTAILLKNPER